MCVYICVIALQWCDFGSAACGDRARGPKMTKIFFLDAIREIAVGGAVGQSTSRRGRIRRVEGTGSVSVRTGRTFGRVIVGAGTGAVRLIDAFATARIGSSWYRGGGILFGGFCGRIIRVRVLLFGPTWSVQRIGHQVVPGCL